MEWKKEEENQQILAMEKRTLQESIATGKSLPESEPDGKEESEDKPLQEPDVLKKVWSEFGNKGNGNKGLYNDTKDDLTGTCAICMEDYQEYEDVVVGKS